MDPTDRVIANNYCMYDRFSVSEILLALSIFMCNRKQGYGGHLDFINFNKSFLFSVECLETWHYRFSVSVSVLALSVFMFDQ